MELIRDVEEEILEAMEILRRQRKFRHRVNYVEILDDVDFRSRFRLTKEAVKRLHDLIKGGITPRTTRNRAVPTMSKLLLTLRYFATGSYLMSAGDFSGVSRLSACRFIREVTNAIASLAPRFIGWPRDLGPIKQGFYNLARFPRVIGAIDCTHVAMTPKAEDAEVYRNRKGVYSMNVQAICDARLIIRDIVARWPGSSHDQTIFNNSVIKEKFEVGQFANCILLGDRGYQSQTYLFAPLARVNSPAENLYNEAQIRSRNVIERCFGVLKSRFPVLRRRITLSSARVQSIVVSCAVLHNMAVMMNDPHFAYERDEEFEMVDELQNNYPDNNNDTRRNLIRIFHSSLK